MAKHVVILGAGASRAAGAPLMFDFLDRAERIWKNGEAGDFEADFELVFEGLYQLQGALPKAVIDVDNLEAVFGAFEMAKLCQKLGNLSAEQIPNLVKSLQGVILRTLELSVMHQGNSVDLKAPAGYESLVEYLQRWAGKSIAFITFNYDLGLDHAMFSAVRRDPSYGIDAQDKPGFALLKLHGSVHWFKGEGDRLQAIPMRDLLASPHVQVLPDTNKSQVLVSQKLKNLGNHSPFIVPPTWKKGDFYSGIADVWRRAAQELQEAENIYVSGFSLPDTDQYFRYLFALGAEGRTRIKKFVVSDPNPDAANRFRSLLGPTALIRFEQRDERFTEFVPWLGQVGLRD